jgi:hypothetical protein
MLGMSPDSLAYYLKKHGLIDEAKGSRA